MQGQINSNAIDHMRFEMKSIEETLVYGRNRFQEGQTILYEGKKARVIHIKPMFVIKVEDRVICGALRNRIKCIARNEKTHVKMDNNYTTHSSRR